MIVFNESTQSETFVLAFTGGSKKLNLSITDFFEAANLTKVSKLVITDASHRLCLGGFPPEIPTFFDFVNFLQQEKAARRPEQLIVVGTSLGGYTALLVGHLLKADQVVVFGPCCYLDKQIAQRMNDPALRKNKTFVDNINKLPVEVKNFFDLRAVLAESNHKTKYYVHVSRYNLWDYRRAQYLKGVPGLSVIRHYYSSHAVAADLARENRLERCFRFPYKPDKRLKYYYTWLRYQTQNLIKILKRRFKTAI